MRYLELKSNRDLKYKEIKMIEQQARLLNSEINLRENMIKDLFEKMNLLQQEAQDISDEILEIEYNSYVKKIKQNKDG